MDDSLQQSKVSRRVLMLAALAGAGATLPLIAAPAAEIHLGMGFRVGEVTQTTALVWTRITARPEPNWKGTRPEPINSPTRTMVQNADIAPDAYEGSMPGSDGELRIVWSTDEKLSGARQTKWVAVTGETDFAHKFPLENLKPGTRYWLAAEARASAGAAPIRGPIGSFRTPTDENAWQDVRFTFTTCQQYYQRDDPRGFRIYPAMGALKPDFFVAGGDNVYYDRDNPRAKTVALCRLHWNRMYALPQIVEFCRNVPGYWEKDDHDTFFDDCWTTYQAPWIAPLTYAEGVSVFREQVPIGDQFYRIVRWGSGLQMWFCETRDYRSPNTMADGPEKSIWGNQQKQWLLKTLLESDAAFKIVATPTALVGPDNPNQKDNHANAVFAHEGGEFRRWTRQHKLDNLFVCNGDRHWQYMSTDPETGLKEFSCGPASDEHAVEGPGKDARYHAFYRPKGGFLSVSVTRENQVPAIVFQFHDVDGKVLHEYRQQAQAAS